MTSSGVDDPAKGDAVAQAAFDHLVGCDPLLQAIVEERGLLDQSARRRGRPDDAYGTLVRAIVGQQLSTKAARTIYDRLCNIYGGCTPSPAQLLATPVEELRAVGLSRAKAAYLADLASHVETGKIDFDALPELSNAEVSKLLIDVKGLGQWTIDMFLIFYLEREDVLPVGDLGIRRAAQLAHGLDGLPTPAELTALAEPWRPYRSIASLYLWASLDNTPA